MRSNSKFLRDDSTLGWLAQFDPADQQAATELLQEMQLVSRDAFAERLRKLLVQRGEKGGRPIGLYAEREVRRHRGVPNRLFKEADTKVKRAHGVGPQPVQPTRDYDPKVGSEGIVAQMVSELCKEYPKLFINHPGPDTIRAKKVRRFVLVTDFIGSGRRASTYLDAAWRVRSVRSWWSARNSKGMSFEVIAYSATPDGATLVRAHPSAPEVHLVKACPTIPHITAIKSRERLTQLCVKYDPKDKDRVGALGFEGTGALIAFAHGVPNNAPRLLHTSTNKWAALFPKRVTADVGHTFKSDETDADEVRARLDKMRQTRLAEGDWIDRTKPATRIHLTVLAALNRSPRSDEALSRRTGLTIVDIQRALTVALLSKWIDAGRRLTDRGRAEIDSARKVGKKKETVSSEPETFYYPKSLRAPPGVSS
jgi:hypothetical protein